MAHRATHLRTEYLTDPIGIDELQPRFFWWIDDQRPGAKQTAYRIRVASDPALLTADKPDLWDSGKVATNQQTHVEYDGIELTSRRRAWWDVTIWDAAGVASSPSLPATFEIGLTNSSDWCAKWIATPLEGAGWTMPPVPTLGRAFTIAKPVASARLYISALGLYDVSINGRRVSDDYFRPGWTDYRKRIQYQTHDVTSHLRPGENRIDALLGDGWYCGRIAHLERGLLYGPKPALLAQLEVTHTDGSVTTTASDATWTWSESPVRAADMLQGEEYDARRSLVEGERSAVKEVEWPHVPLVAQVNESVRVVRELTPAEPRRVQASWGSQSYIYDFGQNFAGIVRLKIRGPRGATIRLRYAEMLKPDGTLYTENLRSARVIDTYTLAGQAEGEVWSPRFTFHGFRYAELSYHDHWTHTDVTPLTQPTRDTLTGLVLMSATPETGSFSCSNPLLNQLQSNIQWGQRSNFLEAPTDCPQRDERLGWTGDAQVFVPTAAYNMDVAAFFTKWSRDIDDAQLADGQVPCIAPKLFENHDGGPGWSDARLVCPWNMLLAYGDRRILARHYEPIRRWIAWQASTARDGVRCYRDAPYWIGFGDWVALDDPSQPFHGGTPRDLIGTAYFAYACGIFIEMARTLGHSDDAKRFVEHRQNAIDAFNREFVTPAGRLAAPTQTACLMALAFDLLPENQRPVVLQQLVDLLGRHKDHLTTGFLGTPLLCPTLARFGRIDLAYKLLLNETYPSWLYTVKNGATTMWERWNSWTAESGFGPVGMNSFNHYAYGAIGRWMYDTLAGIAIDPARPGYEHVLLTPRPGGGLSSAQGELRTIRGVVSVGWTIQDKQFSYRARIPANTTATLTLPNGTTHKLDSGEHTLSCTLPG
jgi:alpha-L-rhamnosidase